MFDIFSSFFLLFDLVLTPGNDPGPVVLQTTVQTIYTKSGYFAGGYRRARSPLLSQPPVFKTGTEPTSESVSFGADDGV